MTEEFLHYAWQFSQYKHDSLSTTDGKNLTIFNCGFLNENSGPDFFSGKVKIGATVWVGNIEIHVRSSDWFKHKHQFDEAYNNVVLHVVYEHDKLVTDANGEPIPTLELKGKIHQSLFSKYEELIHQKTLIPCENLIAKVDDFVVSHCLDNCGVQRLKRKSELVIDLINRNKGDLQESFFQFLAGGFGFKINQEPFTLLSRRLSFKNLSRIRNSLLQIEAALLGSGGFLEKEFDEEYPQILKREYQVLANKFKINSIPKSLWKFYLLRPNNFPTLRIAQFAALQKNANFLVDDILEINSVDELIGRLRVSASLYWDNHYILGKPTTKNSSKILGVNAARNIVINVIVPYLFAYGHLRNKEGLKEKAVYFLEKLPPENNKIIKMWYLLGVRALNSFRSQALIELKNQFCFKKKCLNCNIGKYILKNKIGDTKHSQFL